MVARAVIGANFGDEGKGLMTDYLVDEHESDLVVRFNGGAQAGHTVVSPSGKRHVFSHFGSGTMAGARTLLSRFFLVNPMIFAIEWKELKQKSSNNMNMTIKIDRNAPVSTPYDMLMNQLVEKKRGSARHGSCGLGINESIERSERFLKISAKDLDNISALTTKLKRIRSEWVPQRCLELGLELDETFASDAMITNYIKDVKFMMNRIDLVNDVEVIKSAENPVFEGAQGLLLDQYHEYFPHVTRSSTGIRNILVLAGESNITELEVYYMTRTYLTRHGAGPLERELTAAPFEGIKDETNIINEWQGSLRFAYLDLDLVRSTIVADLSTNYTHIKIKARLGITCLDQIPEGLVVFHDKQFRTLTANEEYDIGDQIANRVGFYGDHFKSFGPSRKTMVDHRQSVDSQIEVDFAAEERAHRKELQIRKKGLSSIRNKFPDYYTNLA